jgi:hypothetical protein
VTTNDLGEACRASPAISQGHIYLRAEKHLYCIRSGATAGLPGSAGHVARP